MQKLNVDVGQNAASTFGSVLELQARIHRETGGAAGEAWDQRIGEVSVGVWV